MRNNDSGTDADKLRQKATVLLRTKQPKTEMETSDEKALKLIHELEVHQIELELQNEELKTARTEVNRSLEKYKELYDFAPSGYFTLSKEGEIVELNFHGANLLGKERSNLIHNRFGFFITDDTLQIFNQFLHEVFTQKGKATCEVTIVTNDKLTIYAFLTGIAIENGEQCLINVVDISQHKMAQKLSISNKELAYQIEEKEKREAELIISKEKAEESDRLKSAFLANMSHEIRTPMNGILGFSELLKNQHLSGERQQKYIGMIEKGGIRMLNIINDLIDISKIESGLTEVILSTCNINEQLQYIYALFNPEVEAKGLHISYKTNLEGNKAFIRTDREKIYAILTNLVKNAIKYSDKGSIEFGYTVKSDCLSGPHKAKTTELVFFVKDSGIGIPLDKLNSIFNRFDQIDKEHKRNTEGAGLGLSIAKAYVAMLGGKIWVESEMGKGSTFYFTTPYINITEEILTGVDIISTEGFAYQIKKLKILIAEDDESAAMLQTEFIQKYSSEIIYATTGVEAVEAYFQHPDLDLIMMDINMPVMDGLAATQQIRNLNKNIVIFVQSAHVYESDKAKAMESGCNEFILKPLNRLLLIEMLIKYFSE